MSQFYYCSDGTNVVGPIDRLSLQALLNAGAISPATPVTIEGNSEWMTAGDFVEHTPIPHRIVVVNKKAPDIARILSFALVLGLFIPALIGVIIKSLWF